MAGRFTTILKLITMEDLAPRRIAQFAACLVIIHLVAYASGNWIIFPVFFTVLIVILIVHSKKESHGSNH